MRRMTRERYRKYKSKQRFKKKVRISAKRLRRHIKWFIKDRYYKDGRISILAVATDIYLVATNLWKIFKNFI